MQNLNFTPEAITILISSVIVLIGSMFIGWNAIKMKINLYWLFFSSFFSFAIAFFLMGLSRVFLNILINRIEYIFMVMATFFLLIAIDYSKRESISPFKMLYIGILGTLVVYFAWQPDAFVRSSWYGYPSFSVSGRLRIVLGILLLTYGLSLCYFVFVIFLKSPNSLKKDALILLIGSVIVGIITPIILLLTDLVFTVPIGVLIMAIVFAKEPKIFFVLPFKANRLTVIHNISGMSLYDYKWSETEIEEHLLAGLLQAVRKMSLEVLRKGEIEEITLTDGVLIFYQSKNITVGLLANKVSKYLKECIEKFTQAFELKFEVDVVQKYVEYSRFLLAKELIDEYFEFVVKY